MPGSSRREVIKILGIIFLVVWVALLSIKVLRQGIYSANLGINVAILGQDKVGLLVLRPEEGVVGWTTFPGNLMVKIFNSEARYPLTSLWHYGLLEKNPYEVVEKTIGLSMGVVVARTMEVKGEPTIETILTALRQWNLKTDLSWRDRFLIRKFLAEAEASKKILEMDIPMKVFDQTVEPDGKEFLVFNSVASLWTKNKFVLESILGENIDLTVNNLSGQSGLGTQVAKQLESVGMRVVEVKSDPTNGVPGKGCLFATSQKYAYTESLLKNQMNCVKLDRSTVKDGEKGITVWLK